MTFTQWCYLFNFSHQDFSELLHLLVLHYYCCSLSDSQSQGRAGKWFRKGVLCEQELRIIPTVAPMSPAVHCSDWKFMKSRSNIKHAVDNISCWHFLWQITFLLLKNKIHFCSDVSYYSLYIIMLLNNETAWQKWGFSTFFCFILFKPM